MSVCSMLESIMIVDDQPENLRLLGYMLRDEGYDVRPVPNGRMALRAAMTDPPDLILLDINMPDMDGYELCQRLKEDERLQKIPVLFISAMNAVDDKVRAFNAGGLDYVTKPFQFKEVSARVKTHIELRRLQKELERHNLHLADLVAEQVKEISSSQMSMIFALSKLSESRDDDTGKHMERVRGVCRILAMALKRSRECPDAVDDKFVENIFQASPLHDIGKVGISDTILLKPGKLTPEEFGIMKTHTVIGADTLDAVRENIPITHLLAWGLRLPGRTMSVGMALDIRMDFGATIFRLRRNSCRWRMSTMRCVRSAVTSRRFPSRKVVDLSWRGKGRSFPRGLYKRSSMPRPRSLSFTTG